MELAAFNSYRESNRLEAKAAQGGIPRSLWETLSAFANSSGGLILLGVAERDDGTLEAIGLRNAHKMLDDFWNAALSPDKLSVRLLHDEDARIERIRDKEIIAIDVPRADRHDRPVFLDRDILGATFRRTHTGDHRCSREEIRFMLMDASTSSQDSRIAEHGRMNQLDADTVHRYRRSFASSKMFTMIDAGERAGSGMSKILRGWQEAGYPEPRYEAEFAPDRTVLTLPLHEDQATLDARNQRDSGEQWRAMASRRSPCAAGGCPRGLDTQRARGRSALHQRHSEEDLAVNTDDLSTDQANGREWNARLAGRVQEPHLRPASPL